MHIKFFEFRSDKYPLGRPPNPLKMIQNQWITWRWCDSWPLTPTRRTFARWHFEFIKIRGGGEKRGRQEQRFPGLIKMRCTQRSGICMRVIGAAAVAWLIDGPQKFSALYVTARCRVQGWYYARPSDTAFFYGIFIAAGWVNGIGYILCSTAFFVFSWNR